MGVVQEWGLSVGDRVAYCHGPSNKKVVIGTVVNITPSGMIDIIVPGDEKPIRFRNNGDQLGKTEYIWQPYITPLTPELELIALRQRVSSLMETAIKSEFKTMSEEHIEKLLELLEGEK